ncbi:actin-like ATPase domain-containing protein [Aspergillus piperis CBS 112811]|uniref:Actin-like ATPase domain-containing protein n=1 Tax=Aspergillus piperis CBS 112811 TaxID=1448313 RepID=A0A8G1R7I7_9EURO|nr:actin-like ATPase domain-containing protein [Aspergillus piperis CBS 112811]RAH60954.1 actin-like ATPase domain-containing protein [Aspergillus piperis CBS 112811]
MSQAKSKLVCGIDYGTTGTAAAWGYGTDEQSIDSPIYQVDEWPVQSWAKLPSTMQYPSGMQPRWGVEATPELETFRWTKLLLDPDLESTDFRDEELERVSRQQIMRLPAGKSAVRVVADYLSGIRNHLEQSYIFSQPNIKKEYWFSIPAGWSNDAQVRMSEAIHLAGFGQKPNEEVCLVTESEASAISILEASGERRKSGSTFCVCDVGGGTVDIACYMITDVTATSYSLTELSSAIGPKSGSTIIDREFLKLMRHRFNASFVNPLNDDKSDRRERLMNDFRKRKEKFTGDGSNHRLKFRMECFTSQWYDSTAGHIILSDSDMRAFFGTVVGQVFHHVNDQVDKATRGHFKIDELLMTGGLMRSKFAREAFSEGLKDAGFSRILFSEAPELSASLGAARKALSGIVTKNQTCNKSYFIECSGLREEPGICLQAFIDEPDAPAKPQQILVKGHVYEEDKPYKTVFHLYSRPGEPPVKTFFLKMSDGQNSRVLARLTCNLSDIPTDERALQPAAAGGVYSHQCIFVTATFRVKGYLEIKVHTKCKVLAQKRVPRIWSERAGN